MKRIISILLILLLLPAASCAEAVLSFSSFDGGGPQYTLTVEDPSLVSVASERVYDSPDHDQMTGAGYDVIYTFRGLKPGTTRVTVSAASPLIEDYDAVYTLTVDQALQVSLERQRVITRFELYRYGELAYDGFEIVLQAEDYCMSVNGNEYQQIDTAPVETLLRLVNDYDLYAWDGFHETMENVLDGEGFWLEVEFADGETITASGSNAFPPRYFDAVGSLYEVLSGIQPIKPHPIATMAGAVARFFTGLFTGGRDRTGEIDMEKITDFYFTRDGSTYPPYFQRYRLHCEGGERTFYHETREGDHWPLTEADITVSGTIALDDAAWAECCELLRGGTATPREESLDDGDDGPWIFIYRQGGDREGEQFAFASWEKQREFEAFCGRLAGRAQ